MDAHAAVRIFYGFFHNDRNTCKPDERCSGGGAEGGQIVCEGTPDEIKSCEDSLTGKYI